MDSWAALCVVSNILKGSRAEQIKGKVMEEMCKELSDPDNCQVRKVGSSVITGYIITVT